METITKKPINMKQSETNSDFSFESDKFVRICKFSYLKAFTYADTSPGNEDRTKREFIREKALESFPKELKLYQNFAFKISIWKTGNRSFDLDNSPKLIIDSFCKKQIEKDKSKFPTIGLYHDDTIDYVNRIELFGKRIKNKTKPDRTEVEIWGKKE